MTEAGLASILFTISMRDDSAERQWLDDMVSDRIYTRTS